jgi:hypothetical protein
MNCLTCAVKFRKFVQIYQQIAALFFRLTMLIGWTVSENIDLLMCWLFYIAQFFSCGYRWEDKYFASHRKHFGDFMDADKVGFESNAFVQWIILLSKCWAEVGLWNRQIQKNLWFWLPSLLIAHFIAQVIWKKKYFQLFKIHFSVLEHIHTLLQEALGHADLSVLTATIGAAALVKNSLWVNLQCTKIKICPCGNENGGSLKVGAGAKKRID